MAHSNLRRKTGSPNLRKNPENVAFRSMLTPAVGCVLIAGRLGLRWDWTTVEIPRNRPIETGRQRTMPGLNHRATLRLYPETWAEHIQAAGQAGWEHRDKFGRPAPRGHSGEDGQARHVRNFLDCVQEPICPRRGASFSLPPRNRRKSCTVRPKKAISYCSPPFLVSDAAS